MAQKDIVQKGYDTVYLQYLRERSQLKSSKYVHKLINYLKAGSTLLDLGCGAGIPVDDLLLKKGHSVIGIDASSRMIAQARKNCPGGEYYVGDLSLLAREEYLVDAVLCFYALFHLPRDHHATILSTMRSFLTPGGMLLITMGDKDFEGITDFYGTPMWWSQWAPPKNRELVERAGFEILFDEIDHSGSENHHVVLARAV